MLIDPCLPGVEVLHAHYVRYRFAPHWHESVCVGTATAGAVAFECGHDRYAAPVGSVLVIPPFQVHTGAPIGPRGTDYRALYLSADRLAELLASAGRSPLHWLDPHKGSQHVLHGATAIGPLLRFHQAIVSSASALEREQVLLAVIKALADDFEPAGNRSVPLREHLAVRRARDYLHAHPAQPITVQDLARVSGVSMYWLAHAFKAATGLAPHAYQIQLRVLEAKRLLAAGWPIADAAVECGFYDQAHLTAQFKRHVGITPGAYARRAAN
jgi:AraC-like DNA-binding protein